MTSVTSLLSGFTDIRTNRQDIIDANLQAVRDIMAASSPADRSAARADDTTYNTAGIAGPALGGLAARGLPYGNADGFGWTINDTAGNQGTIAKNFFNNPRPFLVDKNIKPLVAGSGGSLPSGHTTKGFAESLSLAYIFPERYQQILTRASEYGEHRIVNGVHYPLDVIAGRMVGEWAVATYLDPTVNVSNSARFNNSAASVRGAMVTALASSGQTIAQQAASGPTDRFSDGTVNQANWTRRLTYGLPSVAPSGQPMSVPTEAGYLLATRFPYLNLAQIDEILRTTALPSGVVMDNGNGWARLDLYRAADGYAALAADTTVTMDAAAAQDDRRPGAGFNAADTWRNDIGGPGTLTKAGSGVLTLAGSNSFAGFDLQAGGLTLTGASNLSGSSKVEGGVLAATGATLATAGDLRIDQGATLQLGKTRLAVAGTLAVAGDVTLLDAGELAVAQAATISGTVSGQGGLVKSGTGALTLSGAETYAGATAVQAGTLLVDGSLAAASAVTVAAGARLGGSGTVAGSLTSAGLLSAGDAGIGTGTLTTGTLTLQAGATLHEDIDATGKADTLAVQGAVTLAPGARLDIAHAAGQTQGRSITVLTATGDLTGDFTDAGGTTDLADGATFTDDGRRYRIAYQRAATGSSVTLTDLSAQPSPADLEASRRADFAAISGTSYLSQQTFPVGQRYDGWQIDGLSGIDYDPVSNTFITERDNAYGGGGPDSRTTPPYFTLKPVFAEGQPGYTVQFVGVTPLDVPGWTPATNSLESIRRDPTGDGVWLTSETPHTIYHVHRDGVTRDQLTLPATVNGRFAPGTDNYGLEGLTFTPDGGLWVIREDALQGDSTNLTRITHLNRDGSVVAQYAYPLDTVKAVANGGRTIANPPGAGVGNNGASELLALTNTSFLVLERAWDGIGANVAPTGVSHNSIRIYRIDLAGATDVAATTNLVQGDPSVQPVTKQLIFDSQSLAGTLNTYDTKIDNIEGMSSGPTLPDGHASLVLVSDSNARPQQRKTEFLVLKVQSPIPDEQNWDGTTAMADGFAGGGGGTWSASPGNENWTRADGLINDGWNGRIAAFSGPAGTVTVDAAAGAVSASRLRFLSSGYQVGGAALTVADQGLQIEAAAGTQTAIAAPLAGGVGGLTLSGGGVLTLSGAETYAGVTAVQAGTLLVDGSLAAASAVTVAAGARLGGSGTVAGSLTSAGLLSAGDAGSGTGTLTTGALTLQAGATLQEDIDAVGKADTLAVQGAVTLAPGARLDVARAAGQAQGRRITVLTATGDLTGDFTDAGGTTDLADGTTFTDDGHQYRIAYQRAATGSSVTLIDLTLPPLEVRIDHLSGDGVTFTEDGPPVALDAGQDATVSDDNAPNFGGGTLTAQITANGIPGEDVLGFGGGVALSNGTQVGSGVSVDGVVVVGTIAKTGSGGDPLAVNLDSDATPARVQALLRSLVYRNTNAADPGTAPRSIAVTVGDGVGGTSTAATVTVTVAAVNDPPVLSATPANPTFTEGAGPGVQGSAVAPFAAASVSTVEAGQTITGLTLTVGGLRDGADEVLTLDGTDLRLGAAAQGVTAGHGLSYAVGLSGDTATIALTGTAGVDGAVAAEIVTGLGYRDTRIDDPTASTRTVTLTGVTDSGGGQDTSAPAIASTVTVVAVDDAPAATMPSGPVNAPEQVQTPVDGGLTVQDADSKTLATATMAISAHYVPGQDSLAFAPDTALYGDIQGSFDAGSGVLQLSSAGGSTLAQWQAALRSVSYVNGSDAPDTAARTISLTLNDGSLASVPVTTQVTPVPVNDAPTGTDTMITLRADASVTITAADLGFTDPKDAPADGLKAVVIDTLPTSGNLTLDGAAVSAGQSIAAADLAAGKLRFLPPVGGTGGGQTRLTFQVQDDGGTANGGVDLDPTPRTLSFSILPAPSGGGWGDVHYYTFDGLRYDLQATGDFVITQAVSGAALEIQGRAEGTGGVSFLTAVSVRSGGHDVLFDEARPNAIEVDGKLLKLDVGARAAFGDLVVTRSADEAYRLVTGAGDGIGVIGRGTYMDIDVAPGAGRADGSFEGLLGNLDGDRSNDLALRDGTRLHDHAQALIEGVYADAWRATGPGALIAELGAGTLAERTAWYADHPDANALAVPTAHPGAHPGAFGVTTT